MTRGYAPAIGRMTSSAAQERHRALDQLAADVGPRGYRIACNLLGTHAAAQDAVQEALARACESHAEIRDPEALSAWFYRVLTNLCMRTLRRRRVRRVALGWLRRSSRPHAEPVSGSGDRRAVVRAVKQLPARQQTALVLRYGHDMSIAEVADMLGVGFETAKTHIARGMRRLRELLDA